MYMASIRVEDKVPNHSPLDTKLHESTEEHGSTISFGYKRVAVDKFEADEENHPLTLVYGYHFVEMEIHTQNRRQLIVAVRIPANGVASNFVLKQTPFNKMAHHVAFATAQNFVVDASRVVGKKYIPRAIDEGWGLREVEVVGLSRIDRDFFDPEVLERIFMEQDPDERIHVLSHLVPFLATRIAAGSRGQGIKKVLDKMKQHTCDHANFNVLGS